MDPLQLSFDENPKQFTGIMYRTAFDWLSMMPLADRPINYLEIGAFYGANVMTVCETYAKHNDSKVFTIDPWEDYDEYSEYKGRQPQTYELFKQNVEPYGDKVVVTRGYSHQKIPLFPDAFFDMIYIDGNHEPEFVLEDAVLSFRKLKVGGFLIFDDFGWGGPDMTTRGIMAFLQAYHKRVKLLGEKNTQIFCVKER